MMNLVNPIGVSLLAIGCLFSGSALGDKALSTQPIAPEAPPRHKMLLDYYHHSMPKLAIGRFVITGGSLNNLGRYGLDDFSHTNSFDPLVAVLEKEFALVLHREPFLPENLEGADIVFIFCPDSPMLNPTIPRISDAEIDSLVDFVTEGGSLILMVNSSHKTEKFEEEQFSKLFHRFSLGWNDDDTKYVDITIGTEHPYFYDMDVFHYGAGCTLKYLNGGKNIETLLQVHGDLGDEDVTGPGISLVRYGKGKVLAVGDTGSWGANISRPWSENGPFLLQMFRLMKKDTGIRPAEYKVGQTFVYDMAKSYIKGFTPNNRLDEIKVPSFEDFNIGTKTSKPYSERTGKVHLKCADVSDIGVTTFKATVSDYKHFDAEVPSSASQHVMIKQNRLGSLADVITSDVSLMELSPDLPHLLAFIPNDSIRIGDYWDKIHHLPIPSMSVANISPVRAVNTEMCYVRDEKINGRWCRLLRTSAAEWVDKLDITMEELLQHGSINYRLNSGRGGRFLFQREQWIDKETGVVVRVKAQSRIVLWVEDCRKAKKFTIADIDQDQVTVVAQSVTFEVN